MTERTSWAEYREAHGASEAEEPAAFAAYLNYLSNGSWDGAFREVSEGDDLGD